MDIFKTHLGAYMCDPLLTPALGEKLDSIISWDLFQALWFYNLKLTIHPFLDTKMSQLKAVIAIKNFCGNKKKVYFICVWFTTN